ncbi:putative glycogen phosphorylase [Leptospira broomii serovar Hurstbridge str. 5399]|uniref:Alpha-1,4 glucan phosphorylase n=1 Tax=Leptospira broomii serovar Hurstbridge str. 5399 TaxID=1049789 RepID=T0F5N1_9LEPT|nr:glycogen/starch/alpha-glucan phosphorylase [Leptospira broomii]EQA46425.1 putative glycogen phosphorylase [Leptospira broomii serovar Hurstbridge str. 5399]
MRGRHNKLWKLFESNSKINEKLLRRSIARRLEYDLGKYKRTIRNQDLYQALALSIRDILISRWNEFQDSVRSVRGKRVYYISMEFLIGTLLESNLINLGLKDLTTKVLRDFGYNMGKIAAEEHDAALGNGGLGRLAACFLESMATLNIPCQGNGIRYEYGIFHQKIEDGYQKEAPDNWLSQENPWEISRFDLSYPVHFYGSVAQKSLPDGRTKSIWAPGETIIAQAYDILIPGYNTKSVANLRLWKSKSSAEFNLDYFNHGDYMKAVEDKEKGENISKILYPNDNIIQGKELRLKQEYLLTSATIQDALHTFIEEEEGDPVWEHLPERAFFQMNDTHPSLGVPELMRLLVDKHGLEWEKAWSITKECFAYTNHTVMPEALETWNVDLLGWLLPRHLEIIYSINYYFIEHLKKRGEKQEVITNLSLVTESIPKSIRMSHLAIVGSTSVNGVSELHTSIIKEKLFPDFDRIYPGKFRNVTNGITYRRWLLVSNPGLTKLISDSIGKEWQANLNILHKLEFFSSDAGFREKWRLCRRANKIQLASIISRSCDLKVDPDSIFDAQVKRIHEYKRQLLNVLRIIRDYRRILDDPNWDYTPRTIIFSGKAAPGYYRAKNIIKLIHSVGKVINEDPKVRDKLKVVFLPDYRVSLADRIFPACDVSEQISTAGTEASGTGNMKFALSGAITIGTLDGANIEILEYVKSENFYVFGKTISELGKMKAEGYSSALLYKNDVLIHELVDSLRDDFLAGNPADLFEDLVSSITDEGDRYFVLADFHSYLEQQDLISKDFKDVENWTRKSIVNTCKSIRFSSDNTVQKYADQIWKVRRVVC